MYTDRSRSPSIHHSTFSIGKMSMPTKKYGVPRLEVFSMWFEKNKEDTDSMIDYLFLHRRSMQNNSTDCDMENNSTVSQLCDNYLAADNHFRRTKIEKDPANFKGRIFICDANRFHEIYNSKSVGTDLFIDLPTKERGSKSKLVDSISGHDTELPGTNEAEVEEEESKNEAQMQAPEKTFLPLMGPHEEFDLVGGFRLIVHRDSGESLIDDLYEDVATHWYLMRHPLRFDDWSVWTHACYIGDERFQIKADGLFHSLVLDCIVIRNSKSVHVEVKWVMDENNASTDTDIYICGQLSVSSEGRTSLLFKTPTNKAKKVSLGQSIPLLKSVFAIPYDADFEFSAALNHPNNLDPDCAFYFPTVNRSVPFLNFKKDEAYSGFYTNQDAASLGTDHGKFYKSQKRIDGSGGHLEVTATIDIR